jgi:Ca2+-binding RTX toxin-like protein
MMGIWERLEGRLLWSTTAGASAASAPTPVPASSQTWSSVLDADGSTLIVNNDTGQKVLLPKPTADGSVSVLGSDDADTITVERVTSLPATASDSITQRVYYSTASQGVLGLELSYATDPTLFQQLQDDQQTALDQAKAHQDALVAQQNPAASASALAQARSGVLAAQAGVDHLSAIQALEQDTQSYLLYKMDGVYEIYVAMAGQVKNSARIRIDGGAGNDVIAIATNVPLKASISGGTGADKLTSGSRRSILYGGGGNDRLFSRSRFGATLDGGKGADRYYNRFGEVEILGRNDGDSVMVNDKPVPISQPGTFGVTLNVHVGATSNDDSTSASFAYYFFADGDTSRKNLLS